MPNIAVRVDFKIARNRECTYLGALGFSYKLIQDRTGFTPSQVRYRLQKTGVRLRDYRNGESKVAHIVLTRTRAAVVVEMDKRLPK